MMGLREVLDNRKKEITIYGENPFFGMWTLEVVGAGAPWNSFTMSSANAILGVLELKENREE
jgi:hypothetical protein